MVKYSTSPIINGYLHYQISPNGLRQEYFYIIISNMAILYQRAGYIEDLPVILLLH